MNNPPPPPRGHRTEKKMEKTKSLSAEVLQRAILLRTVLTGVPPAKREISELLGYPPPRLTMVINGLCRLSATDVRLLAEWAGAPIAALANVDALRAAIIELARKVNY